MEGGTHLSTTVETLRDIHPTAVIDPSAEIGVGVRIGPYTIIGPNVVIGDGTEIGSHVLVERNTIIGMGCRIHHGAVLGSDPQDLKYAGEPSDLVIGDRTVIREYATLNRGTAARGRTEVGSDCLVMAYVHIAHDCVIGDHVVLANAVNMGGHVVIEDWASVGGVTAIHQFVRIGCHAFVGGASRVQKDVPPYMRAAGNPIELAGLNTVGLQRRGMPEVVRRELKRAYRLFFNSTLNVSQALERAREELKPFPEIQRFLTFVEESERGIIL
jgi:UDP-N-acetylglucosamine acyltransferase|nr:MAG: acyl-[acyl-carrier-protein]--UDP-N-acetylglucosamine O-acyltransferase [bacterium]